MAETTADKRKPRSRAATVFRVLAAIGILLVLSALLVTPICNMRWNSYARQLREDGQPLTFAEIDKLRTELPDDQNNYLLLEPLFAELEEIRRHAKEPGIAEDLPLLGMSKERVDFFAGVSSGSCRAMKRFLGEHTDTLLKLDAISDIPSGRVPLNIGANPFDVCSVDGKALRDAVKLLMMQNAVMLSENNLPAAIHSSFLIASISGGLDENPCTLFRLVQIQFESCLLDTIEGILRVGTIDTKQLHQLDEAVNRRLEQGTTKWCFWGERAIFVEVCDWTSEGKLTSDSGSNITSVPTALVRHNQIKGTQLLSKLVDAADNPKTLLATAKGIEKEAQQLSVLQCITRIMIPSLGRTAELHLRIIGQMRCTQLALAAEQFRMDHEHLPESLDQLVPDYIDTIPPDPFDGSPMKFTTTDKGIVIYTIGEDNTDNGGDVTYKKDKEQQTDFGFRLLEAKHRGVVVLNNHSSQ